MKNIAKKIISVFVCLTIIVGYIPLFDTVSAANEYLVATDEDWEQLSDEMETLLTVMSFYDYENVDAYSKIMPSTLTDFVYYCYFQKDTAFESGNDPLGYFENSGYCVFDADEIDWIVSNVFNQSPNHDLNTYDRYYYNGNYYAAFYGSGVPFIEVSVKDYKRKSDSSYIIKVEEKFIPEYEEAEPTYSDVYIDACLKNVDGKRVWSYFYIGPEKTIQNIYTSISDIYYSEYAIYDIDCDGTTELIVFDEENYDHIVYTYKNGKAKKLGALFWNGGSLNKIIGRNGIYRYTRVGNERMVDLVEIKNVQLSITDMNGIPDNIGEPLEFYPFYELSYFDLCTVSPKDEYKSPSDKSIAVFSTEKSFTVEPGESMWLAFGLVEDDVILGEWMPMAITVSDPTVISLSEYKETDYGYSLEVTGKKEGFANLIITDTQTGLSTDVVITVRDSFSKTYSYPISEIKSFYPDNKWENHIKTNFYNINGLYVNNYSCSKNANNYTVNFDVYNEKYHFGAVDVYDADGNWIYSEKIDKYTEMSSLYAWGEQVYYLFTKGDWVAYTHPLHTKKTEITLKVPNGGYFVISNNFAESPGCFYYNSVDIFIQGATIALELAVGKGDVDNNVKKFIEEMKGEIKKNSTFSKMLYEAFANVGNDVLTSISQNIMDGHFEQSFGDIAGMLENILNSTLSEFEWKACLKSTAGIGESLFEKFAGPAGTAMKICFSISKSANLFGQAINIACSMDVPYVNVYSKISEGFIAPNGTIVNANGNMDTEAVLQAFKICNNDFADSLVGNNSSKDYDIYNICFVKNDKLVQPNGKVKVYIPIPNNLKGNTCTIYRQEKDGSWTDLCARVENNYLVFETDHFSFYAIIGEKAEISISSLPNKLHYSIGDTLDITGLSLEINGELVASGFFCNPTVLYAVGTQKITVNYNGLTAEFEITVTANSPKINTPSVTTVNYGDTLILTIEDIILPAGCAIEWLVDGNGFSSTVSEDGTECRLTSIASDTSKITVRIVNENGESVLDSDGNEIFDEINLKSKAGFFQKLISFFKNLFRISRIILQSI